jgi:hypothetical protein
MWLLKFVEEHGVKYLASDPMDIITSQPEISSQKSGSESARSSHALTCAASRGGKGDGSGTAGAAARKRAVPPGFDKRAGGGVPL